MKHHVFLALFVLCNMLNAQNFGKINIINNANPPVMLSANGVLVSNNPVSFVSFNFTESTQLQLKAWFYGINTPFSFFVQNILGTESTYQIIKDSITGFKMVSVAKVPISSTPNLEISNEKCVDKNISSNQKSMDVAAFNDKLQRIKKEGLDDNKLEAAMFLFDMEYLSSEQVAAVVNQINFDSKKMEFAKFAYSRTVDKKNFYRVVDVFTYDKDKKELQRWIKSLSHIDQ
jgi:hypothetical protein